MKITHSNTGTIWKSTRSRAASLTFGPQLADEGERVDAYMKWDGALYTTIENLHPSTAEIGFGGELIIHKSGSATFRVGQCGSTVTHRIHIPAPPPPPVIPSPPPPDVYRDELLALLPSIDAGAAPMEVFSVKDHTTATYERNPNNWAAQYMDQLAAGVIWKSLGAIESYGGILISPRHVLYCQHAHPWAANTWPVNMGRGTPLELRWVLPDNTMVSAIQIAQSDTNSSRPGFNGVSNVDLCVALLDRDVHALGVPIMPILGTGPSDFLWNDFKFVELGLPDGDQPPPITLTQGVGRNTNTIPPVPDNDYPQYNNAMVAHTTWPHVIAPAISVTDLAKIHYKAWDGDSGTPQLNLINGIFYLRRILSGSFAGERLPEINLLLEGAENYAMQLGRLATPTGTVIEGVIPPPFTP